ncbi:TPA: hypothetical protein H1009_01185 [archaeon]|nr:hypothetical protein [Candidatus Naiadarchaeales archaeon SRR2090153.bin461]
MNRKAQLEIVALAFLVAGVVTVASAGLISTGGGASSRAIFEQKFIDANSKISEAELFYGGVVNLATRNVLEKEGHDLNDFCPASVKVNDGLKDKIRAETDKLLSDYPDYDEAKLPAMEIEGRKGELAILPVGQTSFSVSGVPHQYEDEIEYYLKEEVYVTDIIATVVKGAIDGNIDVKAFDSSGKVACRNFITMAKAHEAQTVTFSCNSAVKKVTAYAYTYIDEFSANLKTPSSLRVSGTPAAQITIEEKGLKLGSSGYFATDIPATAKEIKPNFVVENILFNDDSNVKEGNVGQPIKIGTSFKNAACGSVEDEFKYQLYNGTNLIAEGKAKGVPPDGGFGLSETFTPTVARTYLITAKIDPENKIPETSETDNEQIAFLKIGGSDTLTVEQGEAKPSVNSITIDFGKEYIKVSKIVVSAKRQEGTGCKTWAKYDFTTITGSSLNENLGQSDQLLAGQTKTKTFDLTDRKVRYVKGNYAEQSTDTGFSCPNLAELKVTLFYSFEKLPQCSDIPGASCKKLDECTGDWKAVSASCGTGAFQVCCVKK